MGNYTRIHETIIRDIVDLISDIDDADLINKFRNDKYYKSLSSQTSGLTLVFPIVTSSHVDIKTATMVAKAQERQAVSMLQILFSAVNINTDKDIFSFLRQYHSNLNSGKFGIDEFINAMNSMTEAGIISYNDNVSPDVVNAIMEDMRNLNFTFEENFNESSLNDFTISTIDGRTIVTERLYQDDDDSYYVVPTNYETDRDIEHQISLANAYNDNINRLNDNKRRNAAEARRDAETAAKIDNDRIKNAISAEKNDIDRVKNSISNDKNAIDAADYLRNVYKDTRDTKRSMLMDADVKKANELMPTMMIVRINQAAGEGDNVTFIPTDVVIGVKAKIYKVESSEIVNRIINKGKDKNWLLKLVKASTREISFFRDFVFAIDKAKIDAKQTASKGSTAKVFKILERRSTKSKILRRIGMSNVAAAISTFHITREEVETIQKLSNMDLKKANTVHSIMEAFNLMSFVYSDESEEVANFIYDTGEDFYEAVSFNSLERESSDMTTKKIINLMTKMSR